MSTIHKTASGFVKLINVWGHGKGVATPRNRPAVVFTDDGDGHYQAWFFTGDQIDALKKLASRERYVRNGNVAVRDDDGKGYTVEPAPEDFWIEGETEWEPDTARYPAVIAW